MDAVFTGFPAAAFAWFEGLERDNTKEYFTAHRDTYEDDVRGALESLFDTLRDEFGAEVKIFRQQRNLRFSKDKTPYKTQTYGLIYGGTGPGTGFYARVWSGGLYAGTGYYMMAPDQLERYREAVVDPSAGPALVEAVGQAIDAGLDFEGEALKTAPRGYPRDHERVKFLRHKSVIVGAGITPGDHGIDGSAATSLLTSTWRTAAPMNAWLDEHVGSSTLPADRWRR